MSDLTAEKILVQCACGARLRLPAAIMGRKVKCPKCAQVFRAEAPAEAAAVANSDGGDALLDQLASAESGGVALERPRSVATAAASCAHCGTRLPAGAVLCVQCGYNTQTGRVTAAAREPGLAGRAAKAVGTFLLGCALSGLGMAIGATLWCVVAVWTNHELGYVAWALGLLTGFGMALGYRTPSALAGVIAAGLALVGIIVAKLIVFGFVIVAMYTGHTSNVDLLRGYVARHLADESLVAQGLDPDTATKAQRDAAFGQVKKQVEKMSRDEVKAAAERYRASDDAQLKDGSAGEPSADGASEPEGDSEAAAGGAALVGAFFGSMFGLIDILFVLLAVGSAYRLGSSGLVKKE